MIGMEGVAAINVFTRYVNGEFKMIKLIIDISGIENGVVVSTNASFTRSIYDSMVKRLGDKLSAEGVFK